MEIKMTIICTVLIFLMLTINNMPANAIKEDTYSPLVLMYHRISDSEEKDAFTISAKEFEKDIKFLKEQGYIFLKAGEIEKHVNATKKSVVITFDDGYESDYKIVLPILEKYNAVATFFIIGSLIGKEGYLTASELNNLSRSDCVQIGNHSYSIHNLKFQDVKGLYFTAPNKIISDFELNRKHLKTITDNDVAIVSYPYGLYGKYVDNELKKTGLITFSSDEHISKSTPYGRFNRAAELSAEQIIKKLQNK